MPKGKLERKVSKKKMGEAKPKIIFGVAKSVDVAPDLVVDPKKPESIKTKKAIWEYKYNLIKGGNKAYKEF